jgi:hypothetical protein
MASSNNAAEFYNLEGQELDFFQRLTKIENEDDLRTHIVDVQRKAFQVSPLAECRRISFLIRMFRFLAIIAYADLLF